MKLNPEKLKKIAKLTIPFPFIIFAGLLPILISVFAGFITSLFGQQLNEAHAPNIPIIGTTLYVLGVSGWFCFITIPVALIVFIGYTIFFIIKVFYLFNEKLKDL